MSVKHGLGVVSYLGETKNIHRQGREGLAKVAKKGEIESRTVLLTGPVLHIVPFVISERLVWLNQFMFARKIRIEYVDKGKKIPCPLKWLDSFSMRNFTNASVFDDTLPVADGQMEIGVRVPIDQLAEAMEDWFRRKGYLPKESKLSLAEV